MLSFRLRLPDLTQPWSWDHNRWTSGESWVEPFVNPVLECGLVHDAAMIRVAVIGRERSMERAGTIPALTPDPMPVDPAHYDALIGAMSHWPGESLTIEMQRGRDASSQVRITAGPYGTMPVYLATAAQVLEGSWSLPDLRHHASADRLLDRAVARALTRRHRYSTDTLWDGVHRLTERATARFTASGLTISYPTPALHVAQPRTPRPGVDLVAAFDTLLTTAVARLAVSAPPGQIGVELSGGADSTNVALAVTALREDQVSSYGLLVDGDTGQQRRRIEVARVLGLHDMAISSHRYPPFAQGGPRTLPHDPTGDYYVEAFEAARAAGAASGMRVVFTGIGGDELMALRPAERQGLVRTSGPPDPPSWLGPRAARALSEVEANVAPASLVHPPSLMAFAARNPLFLQWGMWPVSPLADPLIVRFGESLPVGWRRGKTLLRDRLRRAGLSDEVADPAQPETFAGLMQAGLRRCGLPLLAGMAADSLLVDAGYVDRAALAAAYEQARSAAVVPSLLYDVIALEVGLRSLLQHDVPLSRRTPG